MMNSAAKIRSLRQYFCKIHDLNRFNYLARTSVLSENVCIWQEHGLVAWERRRWRCLHRRRTGPWVLPRAHLDTGTKGAAVH